METNSNNKSNQNNLDNTAKGNTNTPDRSMNNNQGAQGRSNQQATSGQGGMKNIQDMLQQYSGPIAKKISGLTTTQKVVGGSLLALGAGWIAMSSNSKNKLKSKAGDLTSTAKQKMNSKKSDSNTTSHSTTGSTSTTGHTGPARSGNSAVDARVK